MPTIFTWKGYRFFFFSNEGDPREPAHIHVRRGESIAKFWIDPEVAFAESYGYSAKDLNKLVKVIEEKRELIERRWHEYFGD